MKENNFDETYSDVRTYEDSFVFKKLSDKMRSMVYELGFLKK